MNTAEDIKRMLGELVDEAIRIGRAEGEKTLGTDAQLKEQVKRLTDDKRKLAQSLDHVNEENNDLELTIGRLKAALENAQDENETLLAKVVSYDGVNREQAKKVRELEEQVHQLDAENSLLDKTVEDLRKKLEDAEAKIKGYEGTSTEASKEIDRLTARVYRYEDENHDLRERLEWVDAKVKEQAEALAIYRVPTPRACPFCGGPAEVHQLHRDEWYVACGNGDCPVNPETNTFDTEAEAIEAWNNSYNAPKVTCDWR